MNELRPDWFSQGLCWNRPELIELFFPADENDDYAGAKAYCERCPVATPCRDHAIRNDLNFGIWGGLTYRERERYKRNPAAFIARKSTCEECGVPLTGRRRLYCSTLCLRKGSSRRKQQGTQLSPGRCDLCGEMFSRRNVSQKFCSQKCRKDAANMRTNRNRNMAKRTVGCWECDAPTSAYSKYCSDRCRAVARRKRVSA